MTFPNNISKNLRAAAQVAVLASMIGFAGCASHMSKQECESKDLYKMGLQDGQDGKDTAGLQKYTNECQAQGVAVAPEKYNYGRQVGLAKYCDDSRAKEDARKGKTDSVCSREKVPPYMSAYDAQLALLRKQHERDLKDVESNQAKLQKREQELKGQLNKVDEQKRATP